MSFTLDEVAQGGLTVTFMLGGFRDSNSDDEFCMSFGGSISHDYGVGFGPRKLVGKFKSRDAPAPAVCPLP